MLCKETCPKNLECQPLSNIVADDGSSFVCVGLHKDLNNEYPEDRFRHCFKSETTNSMYHYDDYDLKSVVSIMSEALLIDELSK